MKESLSSKNVAMLLNKIAKKREKDRVESVQNNVIGKIKWKAPK